MRARFPLSAKILLWFFSNLLLVALAAYAFIEFEFHLGPESLLGGRAGRRIDALADLIKGEINSEPPSQWTSELARAGNLYGIQLLIVSPDGRLQAGENIELPNEVTARLFRPRPPQPPGPLNPPPGGPDQPPPPGMGAPGDPPGLLPGPPPGPVEHRMVHTLDPSRYWLLMPLIPPQALGPAPPLTLVAVSDSIGLGGLVLDFTPWVAAAGGIVIFSLLFSLPLVRGITGSIREMTGATARVAEGRFDIRVREQRSDELGLLAGSINRMAGRLAGFVNGQKRFLGDIAHELCSPLARAQMAIGILENELGAGRLEDLREEVQQMSDLVNELLSFSKASLAAGRIQLQSIPLHQVLARAIEREDLAPPAVESTVPEDLLVKAEPDLLCRALSNLLRNAVKYAGEAGPVEAAAECRASEVILTISDHGPGVPEEALAQLFDPFYRVDVSRARETGGAGLGLAIVKTCIESCGGRVSCHNRTPHGLAVAITLPAE
jgi:two-component system sensor histidine kinase CpxA